MTHPAIDEAAAAQLRQPGSALVPSQTDPSGAPARTAGQRLKAGARRLAVPVIARLRQELDRAGAEELAGLRGEVADLRDELARTRAEHAAELAALHEEMAALAPPKPPGEPVR